jgi:hypothetical protein
MAELVLLQSERGMSSMAATPEPGAAAEAIAAAGGKVPQMLQLQVAKMTLNFARNPQVGPAGWALAGTQQPFAWLGQCSSPPSRLCRWARHGQCSRPTLQVRGLRALQVPHDDDVAKIVFDMRPPPGSAAGREGDSYNEMRVGGGGALAAAAVLVLVLLSLLLG